MKSYKWNEALVASGSGQTDSVMLQDACLEDWLRGKTFQVIVIIKEKSNDTT